MRMLRGLIAWTILLGSLAALAVRFVPPGHTGKRGDTRLQSGPAWTTPLHRIAVQGAGGTVRGLKNDAIEVVTPTGKVSVGALLTDAQPSDLRKAIAAGQTTLAGAEILYVDRGRIARPSSGRVQQATAALVETAVNWQIAARIETGMHAQARTQGQRRHANQRAAAQARNAAEVIRIQARFQDEADGVRAQVEAEAAALVAEGDLAVVQAQADQDRQRATVLSQPGGRWHLAIQAARRFQFDPDRLDAGHADYFRATWGLAPWRAFFLGGPAE